MTTFNDLTIRHTADVGESLRHVAYDDASSLGALPSVSVVRDLEHGLNDTGEVSQEVSAIVATLKEQGDLPRTATVNSGHSHVVVSLTDYGVDDVYAVFDVNK